ncbi:hypothetical protein Asd1617_06249 (plasmid) [Shigella dysenteriae 1617]|nr:hypothetical protein Asd1617_06249 [Shigella dysenteriae 1617]
MVVSAIASTPHPCTAGQSFNLSDLCRFTRKITYDSSTSLAWEFSSHMRPPSGRAAPVTGRPHTNAGAAPKPQRVEEERRNVTG